MDNVYYDGTKLLSLMDINGDKPEIYMAVGTRTAGKTTYFRRLVFNKYIKKKQKFIVLVRWGYQLNDIEESFFKDIRELFFPFLTMTNEPIVNGKFRKLYIHPNGQEELKEECGYAIAINDAGIVKENSHLFNFSKYDYVIDCVDTVTAKLEIITKAKADNMYDSKDPLKLGSQIKE